MTLAACESDAQDTPVPEFPDIRYGMVHDAVGFVKDGTRIRAYYTNGTGDGFSQRNDDKLLVDTVTFGESQGYRGAYKAITPTDIPSTPELEGAPEGGMQYFVVLDKNGKEHMLEYAMNGDTSHLVEHRKFANEELNLFTEANLGNPVSVVDTRTLPSPEAGPIPAHDMLNIRIPQGRQLESLRLIGMDGKYSEYDVSQRSGEYSLDVSGRTPGVGVLVGRYTSGETFQLKVVTY